MLFSRRRRLFVDTKLQGALLVHTILYWFYCLLSVTLIAAVWIIFVNRPESSSDLFRTLWATFGPAMLGSVLLLPLVLMDCLRLSNRFAGPMVRVQRAMKNMANGEPAEEVHLREGDFWSEFAEDLNRVSARLPVADAENDSPAAETDEAPLVTLPATTDMNGDVAAPLTV
jgi:hypothetical protein